MLNTEDVMSKLSDKNSKTVRRSNRILSKPQKASRIADKDEVFEDEVESDSIFNPDIDEASNESFHDSDWSREQHSKPKKRRKSVKKLRKKPKVVKNIQMHHLNESSRRSTRVKSQPDYCEDSSDDDIYEICDGQPLKLVNNKLHNQQTKSRSKKSTTKSNTSAKKKSDIYSSANTSKAVVSLHPILKLTPETLRDVRQTRSQVSYTEESSDDSYELCDGQPILSDQRSSVSKNMSLMKKDDKVDKSSSKDDELSSELNNTDNEETISSNSKVILVKGQPTLLSEALTVYANDNNFVVHKDLFKKSNSNETLCIWKLHGKLMQKFVQVDASKIFESTSIYLASDSDAQECFEPVKAIVFDKKQDRYLSEVLECPENQTLLTAIKNQENLLCTSHFSPTCQFTKRFSKNSHQKMVKQGRKRKNRVNTSKLSNDESSKTPKKRKRPRKSLTTTPPPITSSNLTLNGILPVIESLDLHLFKIYVEFLVFDENRDECLKRLSQSASSVVASINDSLSSLAEKLLNKTKLDSVLLVDLESFPYVKETISGEIPDTAGRSASPTSIQTELILSGRRYDRRTLVDDDESENSTKRFRLSARDVRICRAYHGLCHFAKHLWESCQEKFPDLANVCERNTIKCDVESLLVSLVERVDEGSINDVMSDARHTLDQVVQQVEANYRFNDSGILFESYLNEDWLQEMLDKLKATVHTACQVLNLDNGD